jgi:hypothetical protein
MARGKYDGQDVKRVPRLMESLQQWTSENKLVTFVLHHVGRTDEGVNARYHGDTPMSLEGLKYGGEETADVVLGTYRPALDPIGHMDFESARAIKGDKFEMHHWQRHVERVERYHNSTFLQLLKNRPGTKTDEFGIEMLHVGESMRMYSHDMGSPRLEVVA